MSGESREQRGSAGADTVSQPGARPRSIEERRRLVAESLQVGNPGNRARDLPEQADPRHDCQIELRVEDIRAYEHNPRRANNAKFAEIKESIRATGIRNPLTVTRRSGEKHFIVEAGGNTRLLAVQQLWAETRDARFEKLTVLFRPWRSESHVLTSHLVENELRGEMTFWDKATGVLALKARLEAEEGRPYSMPLLENAMKGLGLSINPASLSHYHFAAERLRTLGEAIADLSGLDVKTLQPRLNLLKRHAKAQAGLAEDHLYEKVFEAVFRRAAAEYRESHAFSATQICCDCEEALARHLGESVTALRSAIASPSSSSPPETQTRPSAPAPGPGTELEADTSTTHGSTSRSPSSESTVNAAANTGAAPEAMLEAGHSSGSKGENAAPGAGLIDPVRRLAALVGIEDFVRADPAAPLGYRVNFASIRAEPNSPTPISQQVSWLLALLADHFADPAPELRSMGSSELEPSREDPHRQAHGIHPPTIPLDAAFLWRLVDSADQTGAALWDLLSRIRESRLARHSGVGTAHPGDR